MEPYNFKYEVYYRPIIYPRLEFKTGRLFLILPFGYEPELILNKHNSWIAKKINFIEDCLSNAEGKDLIERTTDTFKELTLSLAKELTHEMKIEINNIYFRKMRTKWASLSILKDLTANISMKYLPEYLIEYIVFHEVVHVFERKHNRKFWEIISQKYKDYPKFEKEMFTYWFKISGILD